VAETKNKGSESNAHSGKHCTRPPNRAAFFGKCIESGMKKAGGPIAKFSNKPHKTRRDKKSLKELLHHQRTANTNDLES